MRRYVTFFLSLSLFVVEAQYENYLTRSDINSVLLEDKQTFTVYSVDNASFERSYTALIINKKSNRLREVIVGYDDFRSLKDLNIDVFDTNGNKLDSFKEKDLEDYGFSSSVASDNRLKYKALRKYKYPFIVKVNYQLDYNGTMFYPEWQPQSEEGMFIKSSEFMVIDHSGNDVRYLGVGIDEPKVDKVESAKSYLWQIENIDPYEFLEWNTNIGDYTPYVLTSPVAFKMDDYRGRLDSWNAFGKWISSLNANQGSLEGINLIELDKLIEPLTSNLSKIETIYDYLQTNTRYVSIQLGIGGWQPFSASYVHQNKYGDCKALSNYTISLLDRYGIKGYYALINAGKDANSIPTEFPNAHFNHAIAVIPTLSDTIYLECTSQVAPFGYLGTFTSDRNALLITEDGGKLIRTKKYMPDENLRSTNFDITIGSEFSEKDLNVLVDRSLSGIQVEDNWAYTRYYENETKNREWFIDRNDFGSIDLKEFRLKELVEGEVPVAGYIASFTKKSGLKKAGKRYLINLSDFFDTKLSKIRADSSSKPINIRYGYSQIDSLKIKLPEELYFNNLLEEKSFQNQFGEYVLNYQMRKGKLIVIRKFQLNDGKYDTNQFSEFKKFVNDVISNDRKKIVLNSKT